MSTELPGSRVFNKKDMKTILDFINSSKAAAISFRAPGHKGRRIRLDQSGYSDFYNNMLANDVQLPFGSQESEEVQALIKSTQEYYQDLYGVEHTELVTKGAGYGVMLSIMACVAGGGRIVMGRDSCVEAFSALRLGNIDPVYISPEFNEKYRTCDAITVDAVRKACKANPDAAAVFITSPNKYGMIADVGSIADAVHALDKILIVDQTYGAHLKFFDAIKDSDAAAEDCGADIVINGIGKTLLGQAGTAIINVCSDRVDVDRLAELQEMMGTSDESYLALGSIDTNEKVIRRHGGEIIQTWMDDLLYTYKELSKISGATAITAKNLDPTAINISLAKLGVTGEDLYDALVAKSILPELVHGDYVLLRTGAGNCRQDYETLIVAIKDIAFEHALGTAIEPATIKNTDFGLEYSKIPMTKEAVPLFRAGGRVLYGSIETYPPDTAIVCPGEILNADAIGYIVKALERDEEIIGVDDEGYIFVG